MKTQKNFSDALARSLPRPLGPLFQSPNTGQDTYTHLFIYVHTYCACVCIQVIKVTEERAATVVARWQMLCLKTQEMLKRNIRGTLSILRYLFSSFPSYRYSQAQFLKTKRCWYASNSCSVRERVQSASLSVAWISREWYQSNTLFWDRAQHTRSLRSCTQSLSVIRSVFQFIN